MMYNEWIWTDIWRIGLHGPWSISIVSHLATQKSQWATGPIQKSQYSSLLMPPWNKVGTHKASMSRLILWHSMESNEFQGRSLKRSVHQIWCIWEFVFWMKAQAQCVSCLTNYYSLCEFGMLSEFSILVDFQTGVTIQCWLHIYTSFELNGLVHRCTHSVFTSHPQLPDWVFVLVPMCVVDCDTPGHQLHNTSYHSEKIWCLEVASWPLPMTGQASIFPCQIDSP